MDWKTFFSKIIESLAWPFFGILFLIMFKNHIVKIIESFSTRPFILRHRKAEFEAGVNTVVKETEHIELSPEKEKIIKEMSSEKEDPKMIIQKAYDSLESTLKENLAVEEGISYTYPFELEDAIKKVLPENKFALFTKMKELRNIVAHEPITITSGTSVDYSASALRLERFLNMKNLGIFTTQDGKKYDCLYFRIEKEVVAIGPLPPPGHVGARGEAFKDKAETEEDARDKIAKALGPGSF